MYKQIIIFILTSLIFIGCSESDGYSTSKMTAEASTQPQLPLKSSIIETIPTDWYIRIVAQDLNRGLKSESARLGELDVSDAVQRHSLRSYYDFDGYLDVLFVDPDGVKAGQYRSNFHVYQEASPEQWDFTVMSSDANADISLTWRGLYVLTPYQDEERIRYKEYRSRTNPLVKQMKLIDTETGTEIAAVQDGKAQTYTFNMNGKRKRVFSWIVDTQEVQIAKAPQRAAARTASTSQEKVLRQKIFKEEQREAFDINKPPFLKGGK